MLMALGKSWWHWQTSGDNGRNKALPQTSNVVSDKMCDNCGQEVAKENATEKKRQQRLAMTDKNFQG
jgi:hypothetical protein